MVKEVRSIQKLLYEWPCYSAKRLLTCCTTPSSHAFFHVLNRFTRDLWITPAWKKTQLKDLKRESDSLKASFSTNEKQLYCSTGILRQQTLSRRMKYEPRKQHSRGTRWKLWTTAPNSLMRCWLTSTWKSPLMKIRSSLRFVFFRRCRISPKSGCSFIAV